jgi:DNA polymerase III epsilon subunit-like protein
LNTEIRLRSGAAINEIRKKDAESRGYLTRSILRQMHLMPGSDPVAYGANEDGSIVYYYDPSTVVEAPPELWYFPESKAEQMTLESGNVIVRMSVKHAASCGYYTKERLAQMHYEVIEEPVAYTYKNDKTLVYFFDKKTAIRQPLMCAKCGKSVRYRKKLCESCYNEEMAARRAEGEEHRNAEYNMERSRVLFFDLELTGFYDRDEIISISIVNGLGELVLNTLVKPVHTKKWKKTEKIHGITPEMTDDAPTLEELTPRIKQIFADADILIAYGVSTDYSHIKYIYSAEEEREALRRKIRCCANEFVRYTHECRPDIQHASLTDAMECFGIDWDGTAHTSIADTYACRKVWERLFPNYYKE